MKVVLQRHAVPPLTMMVVLLSMLPVFAQPLKAPKPAPPADQGTALFRGLFHYYGVKPVAEVPANGDRDTIVVILGTPEGTTGSMNELLKTTLAAGGSVFVATDGGAGKLFENVEAIRLRQGPVACDSPAECLRGMRDYPLINSGWNFDGQRQGGSLRLATASPGTLLFDGPPKYLTGGIAGFTGACLRGKTYLDADEKFAAWGTGPKFHPFRCLVMADHKVFNNQFMYASASDFKGITPDNFRIANEVVKWLTADGTRTKCVFIENGKIQPKFDDFDFTALPPPQNIPFPPLPNPLDRPVQEKVAAMIDDGLARIEDDPRLQQALARDPWMYGRLLGFLAIFGLSLALAWFARRVWRARHTPEYHPLPAPAGEAPLGSFEQRRLELLHGGDFRGPIVAYLRQMFESRGLHHGEHGRAMPPLEIRSRNRGELKAMIRGLWDEAFVFDRDPLPYTRWKELEQALSAVKAAAEGDLWEFRRQSEAEA